jgi:glycosyltransferase involved in cell wall biosynthesis
MVSQKKLSVLFLGQTPPPYHGVSVMNQTLLDSRFMNAFDVTVIETNFTTRVDDLQKFSFNKVELLFRYCRAIWNAHLAKKIDVACFPINFSRNPMLRDLLLLLTIKLFRTKIIFYTHGNNLPDFIERSPTWLKPIIRTTMQMSDAAILVGERLRFNYAAFLPDEKMIAVHHGVMRFQSPLIAKRTDDEIRVLYLSNLILSKGFGVVIEAIADVIKEVPNAKFIFAGEWDKGEKRDTIMAFIAKNNLEPYIVWRGRVTGEAKEQEYLSADMFVFPTFYFNETFGIVNLEAMQVGLPILATARGAIPEVVIDGENGFIVPEQDPKALAEKIILLAKDAALRETIKKKNLQRYEAHYTQEKYVERMIHAITELHTRISEPARKRKPIGI